MDINTGEHIPNLDLNLNLPNYKVLNLHKAQTQLKK